jgi:hypothetical protein
VVGKGDVKVLLETVLYLKIFHSVWDPIQTKPTRPPLQKDFEWRVPKTNNSCLNGPFQVTFKTIKTVRIAFYRSYP